MAMQFLERALVPTEHGNETNERSKNISEIVPEIRSILELP